MPDAKTQPPPTGPAPLPARIGRRLEQLLATRGITIAELSQRSGIATSVLTQITQGAWQPTIDVAWKIANAIDVRFGALLPRQHPGDFVLTRAEHNPVFTSPDGRFTSQPLSPYSCDQPFEFYRAELAPGAAHAFAAHPPRTIEHLTVHAGTVEIAIGRESPQVLGPGDWLRYLADVPHRYRALGDDPVLLYIVLSYAGLDVE